MIKSPIVYIGSKQKLLAQLIPLMPINQGLDFVDLFCGSGSVYLNMLDKFKNIYANDVIEPLIDIHKNLNSTKEIEYAIHLSALTKDNQDNYLKLREAFNKTKSWKLLLALIWSCNSNMMRFNKNGKFNQTWGKRCASPATIQNCSDVAGLDLSQVKYSCMKFKDFEFNKNMFIYLDPPYSNTGAGYNTTWNRNDDIDLLNMVFEFIRLDIKFGLSGCINDKPNLIYAELINLNLKVSYFGNLYQNISKKDRNNNEYYFTNI